MARISRWRRDAPEPEITAAVESLLATVCIGGSQLLRASPPARPVTVLRSLRICRLEFSLSPPLFRRQCQVAPSHVPYESLDRAHAAYMPDATWAVNGFLPDFFPGLLHDPGFDVA